MHPTFIESTTSLLRTQVIMNIKISYTMNTGEFHQNAHRWILMNLITTHNNKMLIIRRVNAELTYVQNRKIETGK